MKSPRLGPIVLSAIFAAASPASAIVLFGGDASANLAPPANGAPWRYVAKVGDPVGSGVYLGNRFVLTAAHVGLPEPIVINGKSYARDTSFQPKQINGEDLRIFRIDGDPGLPRLPLIGRTQSDYSKRCVVIGWGMGRGTAEPRKGWNWSSVRVQRWGTNITLPYVIQRIGDGPRLATAFNASSGAGETSLANTDSGCGLFINFGGVWRLAGIGVDVDDNAAYYDRNLSKAGLQPTRSYYVRIRPHLAAINAILNAAP